MAGRTVKETIHAKGIDIGIYTNDFENEFILLTDIARYKSDLPHDVVKNWLRNRETIEQNKPQSERLVSLRELAVRQIRTLATMDTTQIEALPGGACRQDTGTYPFPAGQ